MFEAEDMREWEGHDVPDHERHTIGVPATCSSACAWAAAGVCLGDAVAWEEHPRFTCPRSR
ncbi:hypothetical protein GCM10017776_17870 [Streptomyces griseoluteus]|nr:hypothetical protein GCM10017776_17870 [Streptomyces griseoluteus]